MVSSVAVVDYGMGNLRSVSKALEHESAGRHRVLVTADKGEILAAERVVFPGQGAIRDCMAELAHLDLVDTVREAVRTRPFLGICIGLQALFETSAEHAGTGGLGVYAGDVRRFPDDARDPVTGEKLKIPHMGWNAVDFARPHPLWEGIADGDLFYFVHSFYVAPVDESLIVARTHYALDFTCAVARDNLFAVQFHPEKSQRAGLRLLTNFLNWDGTP